LINPVEMKPNPAVSAAIWERFVSLPSQTRPQLGAKPPKRLTALAHELAHDALLPGAGQKAHAAMHKALDEFIGSSWYVFQAKRESVKTVEGRTIVLHVKEGKTESRGFQAQADGVVIDDAYRRTARIISPDIARTYTEHRARQRPEAEHDLENALIEAREDIGALGLMDNLDFYIDTEAKKLTDVWLERYRAPIKQLPDDRQQVYREIWALSREPQDIDLALPVSRWEATAAREKDGSEAKLPMYESHLVCDSEGRYPGELNRWEKGVLEAEMARNGFRFWYRNPGRPTQDSLGIAYVDGQETRILRPDFLFFAEEGDGRIVVDILDPHSVDWADALAKLQGLARYAATHADVYRRVEAVAEVKGKLRALDLTRVDIRNAVEDAPGARALYEGTLARNYPDETTVGPP
jgi:type III restriction enzyme